MIGIIIAMQKEAEHILNRIENLQIIKQTNATKVYCGTFCNYKVILAVSGIGKVSSAACTQYIIDNFKIDALINIGTAGGLTTKLIVGKVYSIKKSFQCDFDLSSIDDVEVGYNQDFDLKYFPNSFVSTFGDSKVLATADSFSAKKEDAEILHKLGAEIRDMEGSAVAQVAYSNNIKCYILKLITDIPREKNNVREEYYKNVVDINQKLVKALEVLLVTI